MLRLEDWLWKRRCRQNHALPSVPALGGLFSLCGQSTEPAAAQQRFAASGGGSDTLCVVITTHARAGLCHALLEQLERALQAAALTERAFVVLIEDASSDDYRAVLSLLAQRFAGRFAFYRSNMHLGKRSFWLSYQCALSAVQSLGAPHALFLQDDLSFDESFVRDALALWHELDDPNKAVLYLCAMDDDEPDGRWIKFPRVAAAHGRAWHTNWFDLQAFVAGPRFFESLHYQVFPTPASRWSRNPARSSGVGEQFCLRLWQRASVYQVQRTLVRHGGAHSLMNPDARAQRALDNRTNRDSRDDGDERADRAT